MLYEVITVIDDDVIPTDYLFRSYEEMPDIEKIALSRCKGKILDVGAGSGVHVITSYSIHYTKLYEVIQLFPS